MVLLRSLVCVCSEHRGRVACAEKNFRDRRLPTIPEVRHGQESRMFEFNVVPWRWHYENLHARIQHLPGKCFVSQAVGSVNDRQETSHIGPISDKLLCHKRLRFLASKWTANVQETRFGVSPVAPVVCAVKG